MNELDQKYYDQLFERVRVIIQNPRQGDGGELLLHIYRSETWGKPTAWTAFHPLGEPQTILINRVHWESKQDLKRMTQVTQPANPSLVHTQAPLVPESFMALMENGRKIRVPLLGNRPLGNVSGAYYGMLIPPPIHNPIQSEIRLEWWAYGARDWQVFTGWAFKMIELFERAFTD